MKLFLLFLGLTFIGLAFGSFYYTNIRSADNQAVVSTSTTPVNSIYVYREYGDVFYKNKTQSSYTKISNQKVLIANYASVKTGDGRGYVIFPDNSTITLSSSTEIEINYEPTKISIMQLLGSTYHRVTALATGNKYEIRTPNTLAAIRGTKLAVIYNPIIKRTLVAVTEHSVEVTSTKDDGTMSRAPIMVQERSAAEIQSATSTSKTTTTPTTGGSVTVRPIVEVKEIKNFIDENRLIDKSYDATPQDERRVFIERIIDALQKDTESQGTLPSTTLEIKAETRVETVTRVIQEVTRSEALTSKKTTISIPDTDIVVSSSQKEPVPSLPTVTKVTSSVSTNTEDPKLITLKSFMLTEQRPTATEQAFVDSFYTQYEKLFLVNDPVTYCRNLGSITAQDMVSRLLLITNTAGYILPNQTELITFATELINACNDGSMGAQASKFKIRFDVAYSF